METLNHYDVLGVQPSSSEIEIKKAYHRIARLHHPDRAVNGDVEIFKRATLAYETLSDEKRRREYDVQISLRTFKPTSESSWATASAASRAAATAAFWTAFRPPTAEYEEENIYRRRPQQTKFSKRAPQNTSEEAGKTKNRGKPVKPEGPTIVDLTDQTDDEKTDDNNRTNAAQKQRPKKPNWPPEFGTLEALWSKENRGESTREKSYSAGSSSSAGSDSNGESSTRKRAAEDPAESPSKRSRVFDFSEIKNAPPFTQKNGSSFSFNSINDVLNDTFGMGTPRLRQYNRRSQPQDEERVHKLKKIYAQTRGLLDGYTTESRIGFEALMNQHNQRVELLANPGIDPQAALQSLRETAQVLEVLLAGTQEYINQLS